MALWLFLGFLRSRGGSQNSPKRTVLPLCFFLEQHAGVSTDTGPPVEAAKAPSLRPSPLGFGTGPREGLILPQGRAAASVALDLPYRGANHGRPACRRTQKKGTTGGSILPLLRLSPSRAPPILGSPSSWHILCLTQATYWHIKRPCSSLVLKKTWL